MINTKRWLIIICWPIYRDMDNGKLGINYPKLKITHYKNKPCVTKWLYDWTLDLGLVWIGKKVT